MRSTVASSALKRTEVMDNVFLAGKIRSAESRLRYAVEQNTDKQKSLCLLLLVLHRMAVRNVVGRIRDSREAMRATKRAIAKGKQSGVEIPLLELRVAKLDEEWQAWKKSLSSLGERIIEILDLWEFCGATLRDLAALCNLQYERLLQEIDCKDGAWVPGTFSELVMEYNLDFKHQADFMTFEFDAPLTHATKEYLLDTMLNTPEGREASHRALETVFPEIMENAMTLVTDADGVQRLIDKDGVEVGTVGEED